MPIWEPRLAEILGNLSEDSVVVVPGANQSSVELLKSREHKMEMRGIPTGNFVRFERREFAH